MGRKVARVKELVSLHFRGKWHTGSWTAERREHLGGQATAGEKRLRATWLGPINVAVEASEVYQGMCVGIHSAAGIASGFAHRLQAAVQTAALSVFAVPDGVCLRPRVVMTALLTCVTCAPPFAE
eukprot:1149469-Pelagomonas_calceolata.AAC.5